MFDGDNSYTELYCSYRICCKFDMICYKNLSAITVNDNVTQTLILITVTEYITSK